MRRLREGVLRVHRALPRRGRGLAWVALVAVLTACGDAEGPVPQVDAPPFELESLEGAPIALADFTGKVLIVDFWATWCAPCLVQIPILNAFAAEHEGTLGVLGVSVDVEGREAVESFVKTTPIDYPVVFGDEALARQYGAPGFPALAVVDPEGKIDSLHVGVITPEALAEAVRAATP